MFGEDKNLKDSANNSNLVIKDTYLHISYTKTHKLITALYMVTDVIDKDEPLRIKLRTLGTGIISDMNAKIADVRTKISEIMSFLDIASAINIISVMNCNILKKEFLELDQSIKEAIGNSENKTISPNKQISLTDFFRDELPEPNNFELKGQYKSIGHRNSTRIGVQKGSTLMNALSDRKLIMSDKNIKDPKTQSFDFLKKERRFEIINAIKNIGTSATITDIKNGSHGTLLSFSEKTLQRELVAMVKDGVLNKTGEKRWSKYFIKN